LAVTMILVTVFLYLISLHVESDNHIMRWMFVLTWVVSATCLLVLLTEAFPVHFACKRKIKVGAAIMAGHFQSSNRVSIKLGSIPCGGTLQTGVLYTPNPRGLNSNHYLIDVSKTDGTAFPGAQFVTGAQTYDGAVLKSPSIAGNVAAWTSFPPPRVKFSAKPATCPNRSLNFPGSKLKFSTPGTVVVRIAWSLSPLQGVMVSAPCQYKVTKPRGKREDEATASLDAHAEAAPEEVAEPTEAAEARS
jgi:hypothetical protein